MEFQLSSSESSFGGLDLCFHSLPTTRDQRPFARSFIGNTAMLGLLLGCVQVTLICTRSPPVLLVYKSWGRLLHLISGQ